LGSLIARCYALHREDPTRAPTVIFIKEGVHEVDDKRSLNIRYPLKIVGAGRNKTIIHGGFDIRGPREEGERVDMQGMTIKGSSGYGLLNDSGLPFLCKDMTFTQCDYCGVLAYDTRGRLINCVITQCGSSGIHCSWNALIEVEGSQTKVDGNGTSGDGDDYGLDTDDTSSRMNLLFPLTKESVSTNHHGGRNHGGTGTIKSVNTLQSL
jgi:hypothetical protein